MKLRDVVILIGAKGAGKSTQAHNIARTLEERNGAPADVLDTWNYLFDRLPRNGGQNVATLADGGRVDLLEQQHRLDRGLFVDGSWSGDVMVELMGKALALGHSCILPGSPRSVKEGLVIHDDLVRLQTERTIRPVTLVWIRFSMLPDIAAPEGEQEDFSIADSRFEASLNAISDREMRDHKRERKPRARALYLERDVPALDLLRYSRHLETEFGEFEDDGDTPPDVITKRICKHFGWPIPKVGV